MNEKFHFLDFLLKRTLGDLNIESNSEVVSTRIP